MVGAGSGWGSVWFLFLWRSSSLVWVVFLAKTTGRVNEHYSRLDDEMTSYVLV